jgi:hypothetical protein
VGIGTTSTAQKLHIVGSTLITNGNYHYGYTLVGAQASLIGISASDNISVGQDNVNHANTIIYGGLGVIDLSTSGSTRMRVGYNGDVGIGTTTPDIFGRFYTRTIGFNSAGSTVMQINGTSYGGIDIGAAGTRTFGITASGTEAQITTVTNIPLIFNINSVPKMTLNSTGLGIGTSSPTGELHIYASQPAFRIQSSVSGSMQFGQWDGTYNRIQSSARDFLLISTDATNLIFSTNTTERMRLTSGGNLGIGTTSINAKLDVLQSSTSNNQFKVYSDDSTAQLRTYSTSDGYGLIINQYYAVAGSPYLRSADFVASTGDVSSTMMRFFTKDYSSNPAERVRITSDGNIGIGTTSPANNLVVYNGSGWAGADLNGTSGGELIFRTSGTLKANIYASTSTGFVLNGASETIFQIGASEKMRLTGGNLGIGTTGPVAFLDIVGNGIHTILRNTSATSYTSLRLYNDQNSAVRALEIDYSGASYSGALITSGPTGESACVTTTGAYPLAFGTNNTARMTILSGGNVGIGTTAPAYNLDVTGSISADAFLGKSFGLTGTSGSTAIYDAYVTNGTGEVYELMATGNPNSAGSGYYKDVMFGKIIIGTGWNGSAVTTYINYVQENPDPRSLYSSGLGTSLSASIFFKSGSSEVSNKPVLQYTKIRVKIGSYNSSNVGNYTTVRVKRLF